jgi:hypothetical protein
MRDEELIEFIHLEADEG